ncbi:MAG: NAD(P)H-binding protein [Akkermansiaceae bacterium]|nr:NAD(P)H-binding protein [Akkermansiaceae bacterium]
MERVPLFGAGKIGSAICKFLSHTGDYEIVVADVSEAALARLAEVPHTTVRVVDVDHGPAVEEAMQGCRAVISALTYTHNPRVARAALAAGASYFDLTEDVRTTREVMELAAGAGSAQIFMPQCGLAPGFVSIVANDLAHRLDEVETIKMRVGALPLYPSNSFKYNLTWSTDGLINEYCNPCEAIHDGTYTEVLALEGHEQLSIDGVGYEAFNTSGGLGTLCDTFRGRVQDLNYKTVRYPGHRDLVDFLVNELKLRDRREVLRDILENAVAMTLQDVVIVFCTVAGRRRGRLHQITDARKIYHSNVAGEMWSAIQITTAAGVCAAVDLHLAGQLAGRGFVRQEELALDAFLANRFGQFYAIDNPTEVTVRPVQGDVGSSWQTLSRVEPDDQAGEPS